MAAAIAMPAALPSVRPCRSPAPFLPPPQLLPWLPAGQCCARRQRVGSQRLVHCPAGSGTWRFDDLSGSGSAPATTTTTTSSSLAGMSGVDDLWREQMRAMERAQAELADMQRQMDQRFEAAQREARQLQEQGGSSSSSVGPSGYRWQSSVERSGPGGLYREYRSESFTVIGVPPPGGSSVMGLPQPQALHPGLHLGPLSGLGLLLAAALAGFWAAATAALHQRFHLTVYRERSRWPMLLLWPLLLLVSPEFRQQFWAAVRGKRAAARQQNLQQGEDGGAGGEQFVASMQAGKQA